MTDITKFVGKQIRKFRTEKGMTQKELGLLIGVKHNTISSFESGINEPGQDVLFAIAKSLNKNIDDFFPPLGYQLKQKPDFVAEGAVECGTKGLALIPIIGSISCGNGSFAYEDIEGYESTPKSWLAGGSKNYFYLRAKGDSMIGARIHDGDLLLIRKQADVDNGEIAAVLINDDALLKRVYKSNGQLILQSENPKYPPIIAPPAEVKILGKLKKIVINL